MKILYLEILRVPIISWRWYVLFLLMIVVAGCANIVSPTGGPRDTSPPEILQASPPSGSVNFAGNSFTLRFNEFIQTGNLLQQMLISPPMSSPPKTRIKGKSLIITFSDTLHYDVTYAVYLGNSIQDITEKNPMPPYTYFFSTGAEIDNHYIKGHLLNAYDHKVPDNPLVMLFEHPLADSAAAKELPRYVTRPDKAGHFEFKHLADRPYHLIAIQDLNNNMRYDLITETVGFISEPIIPRLIIPPVKDTLTDTVITVDTTTFQAEQKPEIPLVLRMFVAEDSIQKILTARSEGRNKAVIALRYPLVNPEIVVADSMLDTISIVHLSTQKDTITIWLKRHNSDTLRVFISDPSLFFDTVNIHLRQPSTTSRASGREIKPIFSMNVARGGKLNPSLKPMIIFSMPLSGFDKGAALLRSPEDTVPLELTIADSLIQLKYYIANSLTAGTEYSLLIPQGACTGWDGSVNDTLAWSFTPDVTENYGTISALISADSFMEGTVLLLLTDEKMNLIESRKPVSGVPEKFHLLLPGKYYLKAVNDLNNNGKWDTGDYWKGFQPEKTLLLSSPVTARANWEEEVLWEVRF